MTLFSCEGWNEQAHHLCIGIGRAPMAAEEGVVLIFIWERIAAHEQHVLQVVT